MARGMLLQATYVHIINDRERSSPVSRQFHRLRARGFPHKKALTAAGNKMSRIVFAVLKSKREYKV